MSISTLTAFRIMDDPDVYTSAVGPFDDGKYGLYIGTFDETPSGFKRVRDLLTSSPAYDTAEAAKEAADKLVAEIRTLPAKVSERVVSTMSKLTESGGL